jgi:hypothetical protein
MSRVHVAGWLQAPQLSPSSVMPEQQSTSPSASEGLDFEAFLAPGTTLLETLEADLDNDGDSEMVLSFGTEGDRYGSGASGIAIVARDGGEYHKVWEARPSSEGQVADVVIRDINKNGIPEVLFFKSTEDGARHFLHVFAWDGTRYTSLSPNVAGPGAEEAFTSVYYPPQVRNVDSTALEEIVVFEDDASSERLKAIVHRWDGEAYRPVDWIVMLGPLPPAEGTH